MHLEMTLAAVLVSQMLPYCGDRASRIFSPTT